MKFRYTKFVGDPLGEIDLEDLVSRLSDLLLSSGFSNPWSDPSADNEDRTMQALHDAILDALFHGGSREEFGQAKIRVGQAHGFAHEFKRSGTAA